MRAAHAWWFILLGLSGCVPDVTVAELSGRWELHQNHGRELLELNADGTFTHELVANGKREVATGAWELTDADRAPSVLLRYQRDFDGLKSGASLNIVRRWDRDIGLSTDPDRKSVFLKV